MPIHMFLNDGEQWRLKISICSSSIISRTSELRDLTPFAKLRRADAGAINWSPLSLEHDRDHAQNEPRMRRAWHDGLFLLESATTGERFPWLGKIGTTHNFD